MTRHSRRPSKPQRFVTQEERELKAAQERAKAREQARLDARDPASWGPNAEQLATERYRNVTVRPNLIARCTVFDALLRKGTLSQAQAAAGHAMIDLWAKWKGLAGRGDRQEGYIDNSRAVVELINDRMIQAGKRYQVIMGRIGRANAVLLTALAEDWFLDTGRDWQTAVRSVYPIKDANKLSAFVTAACENVRIEIEVGALRQTEPT